MDSLPHTPMTVILPIRDRTVGLYTLKFLQGQMRSSDELLISFNNTSDRVVEIMTEQARLTCANLKILRWEKTVPIYPHWKAIIDAASNDAILFVHDDDVYHGGIVERIRGVFDHDPDASFITSQMINISLSHTLEIRSDGSESKPLKYDWQTYYEEKRHRNFVAQFNTSFYGFKRSKLRSFEFLEKNPLAGDFLLFFSGLLGGNLYVLPEFLAARLQHGSNAVYNEFFKPAHPVDSLELIFERFGLRHTPEGVAFLDHAKANAIHCYEQAWKNAIVAGIDPKKLVIVLRRLRMLDHSTDLTPKYLILQILMSLRFTGYWKPQKQLYSTLVNWVRKVRGPSKFYRRFPEISLGALAEKTAQPLSLIEDYLDSARQQLGLKL